MTAIPTDLTKAEWLEQVTHLRHLVDTAESGTEARAVMKRITEINRQFRIATGFGLPETPLQQAQQLDAGYVARPHLEYLSSRIAKAVSDVERGQNRFLATSMPPRAGKSTLTSLYSPLWILRRHPEWRIVMTSFDSGLVTGWARQQRNLIEDNPDLGIILQPDGGAGGRWSTVEKGGMYSVGVGGALTGRGARVLIIDDPVADFVAAHSPRLRQNLWDWWLSVAQTRLEPPYLVMVTMTRWHEDDFVGRLFNPEYEGEPKHWERIVIPAIAEKNDILGRDVDEPLLSPLVEEDAEAASRRWEQVKVNVGSYTWFGMYQQRPAPPKGAIFDAGWWRFWSWDPEKATEDGRVVHLDPGTVVGGEWVDSWDLNFDSGGDYVVGQRWLKQAANRYLLAQVRDRWAFTSTLRQMQRWSGVDPTEGNDPFFEPYSLNENPWGEHVHTRLIEKKANGAAALNVLHDKVSGLRPVNPRTSKEMRARAVTPEIESGNVYLPHPSDPGNEWVTDLLSELRNFPHDAHDDQVDALTQALEYFRPSGRGGITNPASARSRQRYERPRSLTAAARSDLARRRTR